MGNSASHPSGKGHALPYDPTKDFIWHDYDRLMQSSHCPDAAREVCWPVFRGWSDQQFSELLVALRSEGSYASNIAFNLRSMKASLIEQGKGLQHLALSLDDILAIRRLLG